jgi:hypothetical protein
MFREETLDQARVQVWIQVGAAVRNYKQTKVSIRRLEQRGEHDTARRNAE